MTTKEMINDFIKKLLQAQENEPIEYPITPLAQLWGEKNGNGDGALGYCVEVQIRETEEEQYGSDVESFGVYCDEELIEITPKILNYLIIRQAVHEDESVDKFYLLEELIQTSGYSIQHDKKRFYISHHYDAGEDFSFTVEKEKDIGGIIDQIISYVEDYDYEEHVKTFLDFCGERGVPALSKLIDDAKLIGENLNNLKIAVSSLLFSPTNEEVLCYIQYVKDWHSTERPKDCLMTRQEAKEHGYKIKIPTYSFRQTLDRMAELGLNVWKANVANECENCFNFEYTSDEFEQLCSFVEDITLGDEYASPNEVAKIINRLVSIEEKSIQDVLDMYPSEITDLICY